MDVWQRKRATLCVIKCFLKYDATVVCEIVGILSSILRRQHQLSLSSTRCHGHKQTPSSMAWWRNRQKNDVFSNLVLELYVTWTQFESIMGSLKLVILELGNRYATDEVLFHGKRIGLRTPMAFRCAVISFECTVGGRGESVRRGGGESTTQQEMDKDVCQFLVHPMSKLRTFYCAFALPYWHCNLYKHSFLLRCIFDRAY